MNNSARKHPDLYDFDQGAILDPPNTIFGRLKYLGPSFILSASIVGSGELIATTTLGAEAGYVTFWVILVSCIIKVAVQLEFGKHTILTGETAMQSLNRLPGFKIKGSSWSVWSVLVVMLVKLLQVGGIVGGVAIILQMLFPSISVSLWSFVVAIAVGSLVSMGYYRFVERFSIVMIGFFTLFTFTSLYFLSYTEYAISGSDLLTGLTFQLPASSVVFAIGAFGITGVGADEIIHYNYWCLEKGYARHAGRNDGSPEWELRAKGWIKVMHLDAILAMVIYTTVTAAFYLLGAAVLNSRDEIPAGFEMVETLSMMYTETLGEEVKVFFLLGSFVVLFSTLFAALAAWTRQYVDIFGALRWMDFNNLSMRIRVLRVLSFVIPLMWMSLFLFIQLPVLMVISGGIVGSFLLLLVCHATYHFRYDRTPDAFKPTFWYDLVLWLSLLVISAVGVYGLFSTLYG